MDSVKETLDNLKDSFHKRMAAFEEELHSNPGTSSNTGSSLATEFANFKSFTVQALSALQDQITIIDSGLDRLEMRGRRKMLLLHGLPEATDENLPNVVVQLVREKMNVAEFSTTDIKRCHRLGRTKSTGRARPVICKFHEVAKRDKIWFSKSKLKGSGKTISEFLTRVRHNAFMLAREKFGVAKCWTREGIIFVQAVSGELHRATTVGEVKNIAQKALTAPVPVIPEPLVVSTPVKISKPKRAGTRK